MMITQRCGLWRTFSVFLICWQLQRCVYFPLSDGPVCSGHFCGEVWPHNRRLLQKGTARRRHLVVFHVSAHSSEAWFYASGFPPTAGGGGRAAVHAGNPGHRRNSKSNRFKWTGESNAGFWRFLPSGIVSIGAVYRHEGPVHEERPRIRPGVLHHSAVDIQRPSGPPGADPSSEGHRGRECWGFWWSFFSHRFYQWKHKPAIFTHFYDLHWFIYKSVDLFHLFLSSGVFLQCVNLSGSSPIGFISFLSRGGVSEQWGEQPTDGVEMSAGFRCRRFSLRLYLDAAPREHFIYSWVVLILISLFWTFIRLGKIWSINPD